MGAFLFIRLGGCWIRSPPRRELPWTEVRGLVSLVPQLGTAKYEGRGARTASPRVETEGGTGGGEYNKVNEQLWGRQRMRGESTACKGVMIPSKTGIRDRVTIHTGSLLSARTEPKDAADSQKQPRPTK